MWFLTQGYQAQWQLSETDGAVTSRGNAGRYFAAYRLKKLFDFHSGR